MSLASNNNRVQLKSFWAQNLFFICMSFLALKNSVFAESLLPASSGRQSSPGTFEGSNFEDRLFKDTYVAISATKTMPLVSGDSELSTTKSHWHLGYRYIFHPQWLLGVGGGFKLMKQKYIDRELPIFNLYQEINYMTRLFYPHFIYLGTKLMYLLPVQKAMVPMKKNLDYNQEVGIAIGIGYLYRLGENSFLDIRIDRWRGTATMKLQAAEVNLSYNFAI